MMLNTPEQIEAYRILTMKTGLQFEVKTGMKLCRGKTCYTLAKNQFGFKGNKAKVLAQLEAWIDENISYGANQ